MLEIGELLKGSSFFTTNNCWKLKKPLYIVYIYLYYTIIFFLIYVS